MGKQEEYTLETNFSWPALILGVGGFAEAVRHFNQNEKYLALREVRSEQKCNTEQPLPNNTCEETLPAIISVSGASLCLALAFGYAAYKGASIVTGNVKVIKTSKASPKNNLDMS